MSERHTKTGMDVLHEANIDDCWKKKDKSLSEDDVFDASRTD